VIPEGLLDLCETLTRWRAHLQPVGFARATHSTTDEGPRLKPTVRTISPFSLSQEEGNIHYLVRTTILSMFDLDPEDITDGPLLRGLLVLAAPLLAQNVVQVVQQVVDLFWVGRLSSNAVAAVGLTIPLIAITSAVVLVLPFVGTQVLVSQRVGGDDISGAQRALFTGLVIAVGVGLVIGVIAFVAARPLIDLLLSTRPESATDHVVDLAVAYFGISVLGMWISAISDTTEAAFIGWGDSRMALYMNLLALGLGILLDPFLIFGFNNNPLFELLGLSGLQSTLLSLTGFGGVGIEGAAFANIIGYGMGGLLGLTFVARGRNGGMLSRTAARIDFSEIRSLFDIGSPVCGQLIAKQVVELVLVLVAFEVGGAAGIAAYIVGFRVASVAVIPSNAFKQATQSIVGQNLGAGSTSRARRVTWFGVAVAVSVLFVVGIVQWAIPQTLVNLFVPTLSADATELAVLYLTILAYGYPAIGASSLLQAGFNGASRTRTTLVASLFQYWGIRLPIAIVGGIFLAFEMRAVFWAVTLSNIIAAIGLGGYYYYSTADGMLDRAVEATEATAD
jgi:putative MATE family efflux protein